MRIFAFAVWLASCVAALRSSDGLCPGVLSLPAHAIVGPPQNFSVLPPGTLTSRGAVFDGTTVYFATSTVRRPYRVVASSKAASELPAAFPATFAFRCAAFDGAMV